MTSHICATCGLPVKKRFFKRGRLRRGGIWQHVGVPGKKACGREPTPKLVKADNDTIHRQLAACYCSLNPLICPTHGVKEAT